jgi:hypothetical protein
MKNIGAPKTIDLLAEPSVVFGRRLSETLLSSLASTPIHNQRPIDRATRPNPRPRNRSLRHHRQA